MTVYFVRAGEDGPIKIGTAKNVARRLYSLRTASPEPLTILGVLPGGAEIEAELHARFKAASLRGEWFNPVPALVAFLDELLPYQAPPRKRSNARRGPLPKDDATRRGWRGPWLPWSLVEQIDRVRGDTPRAKFIRAAIEMEVAERLCYSAEIWSLFSEKLEKG